MSPKEAQEQELSNNSSWKFVAALGVEIFTFEDKPLKLQFSLVYEHHLRLCSYLITCLCHDYLKVEAGGCHYPRSHYSPGDMMWVTCGKQIENLENCNFRGLSSNVNIFTSRAARNFQLGLLESSCSCASN